MAKIQSTIETIHILNHSVVLEPGNGGNRPRVDQIVIREGVTYRAQINWSGLRVLDIISPPEDLKLEARGGGYHL